MHTNLALVVIFIGERIGESVITIGREDELPSSAIIAIDLYSYVGDARACATHYAHAHVDIPVQSSV